MRLLVVGAGLVGARVLRDAAENGWETAVLDRDATALDAVRQWAPAGAYRADAEEGTALNDTVGRLKPAAVVHAAAHIPAASLTRGAEAERWMRRHLSTAASVMRAASIARVRRVVLTSSLAVYDLRSANGSLSEAHTPAPRSVYGRGKYAEELLAARLLDATSTELSVLRLVGTYGRGRGGGRLHQGLQQLCIQAKAAAAAGRPVMVPQEFHGREFLHVTDAARAILTACEPQRPAGLFNIATGHLVTANRVAEALTGAGYAATAPASYSDVAGPLLATVRAEDQLGFRAHVGLNQGIADLLAAPSGAPAPGPSWRTKNRNDERLTP